MAEQSEAQNAEQWGGDFDPFADPEERRVLFGALDSYRQYRKIAHFNTTHRRRQNFYALPSSQWQMLAEAPFSFLDVLNTVDDAIDANADVADEILSCGLDAFSISRKVLDWHGGANANDTGKAHSTLRQFYRDWSAAGSDERAACYAPVLEDLFKEYPSRASSSRGRVLIPGAGLGRLVFEICRAGFFAEGNEISYHQLLASNWILNHSSGPEKHILFPFAAQFTNVVSRKHQLQSILVPDVHPATALAEASAAARARGEAIGEMNMSAADFVALYLRPDFAKSFDAVVTVFFIDTAPNVIRYVQTIQSCLRPGGVWINLGPLYWHFDNQGGKEDEKAAENKDAGHRHTDGQGQHQGLGIGEPGSVELSEEEVRLLIEKMGFTIEMHELRSQQVGYIQDPQNMLQNLYRVSHWVARKNP